MRRIYDTTLLPIEENYWFLGTYPVSSKWCYCIVACYKNNFWVCFGGNYFQSMHKNTMYGLMIACKESIHDKNLSDAVNLIQLADDDYSSFLFYNKIDRI